MVEKSVKSISSNKMEQNIEDSCSEFSLRLSMHAVMGLEISAR